MNHLAHLLLAGPDPALRAGGFLGDFVRGALHGERPAMIEQGIALHRHIDASTDRHPAVRACLVEFRRPWRRWAPVAMDVWFDHLLSRRFPEFADQPLEAFAAAAHADLDLHRAHYPAPALRFLDRMQEHALLCAYRQPDTIRGVLARLAMRSPRAAPLNDIDVELTRLAPHLDICFETLLPDLLQAADAWRTRLGQTVD